MHDCIARLQRGVLPLHTCLVKKTETGSSHRLSDMGTPHRLGYRGSSLAPTVTKQSLRCAPGTNPCLKVLRTVRFRIWDDYDRGRDRHLLTTLSFTVFLSIVLAVDSDSKTFAANGTQRYATGCVETTISPSSLL